MNRITPEYISNYISFQYGNTDWNYDPLGKKEIPKIQAEGSAKLWNILQERQVALLADEVGMGKTYQALAIMITLWLENPQAKILIYAPNENVGKKWIKEYETFIRYHYKLTDDKIKSSINGEPLRKAIYCESQLELLKFVNQGWPSLFVCKTSSLSNFLSKKISEQELVNLNFGLKKEVDENSSADAKEKWMYRFAKKSNDFVYKKFSIKNKPPFDLIVFDEAHYLRNSQADTNKSLVAHAFFAKRDIRKIDKQPEPIAFLADKVLLLTATPNHSSDKNIVSIISIFNNNFKGLMPSEILDKICVRRFRRLNGKTKHQYRIELDEPVEMPNIKEKIFFAMYQRSLVKQKAEQFIKNKDETKKQNPYRLLFGYLEGFEFLPNKKNIEQTANKTQSRSMDFDESDDKRIIQELADAYNRVYKHFPMHPKYIKTVENLSPKDGNSLHPDKKVVFVRRIPSVKELSRRAITGYDEQFATILFESKAFPLPKKFRLWSETKLRSFFANQAKKKHDETDEQDSQNKEMEEIIVDDPLNVSSKYYSLFTKKKEGKYKSTDCVNFRNRFTIEFSLFSVFMQPAADYFSRKYVITEYLYHGEKRNYAATFLKLRFDALSKKKQDYLFSHIDLASDLTPKTFHTQTFPTLFSIWISVIEQSKDTILGEALIAYKDFNEIEKEAFSNYITKGLLFSSSYLIVFYANFKAIEKSKNLNPLDLYIEFCNTVEAEMLQNGLAFLIAKAVITFRIFYKKELNLTEEKLLKENWSFLNNTNPVVPVWGGLNRSSILKAFNTPFYPNVLVATSVLQEGVDLHYHCNEVIHYGLAWTQGDNEQRVGRVDRLNGKMEKELEKSDDAVLQIHYPYLKNTIDQDQTARFILRKKEAEKLIDQFVPIEQSKEINHLERVDESVWKNSFNKPSKSTEENKDPFPVDYKNDFNFEQPIFNNAQESVSSKTILDPILSTLLKQFKHEFFVYDTATQKADKRIFAIKHIRENTRHQPIIGELSYYEPGLHVLAKPVYCLRLITPIYRRGARYDNLINFGKLKDLYAANPVIKIGFDNSKKNEFKYFVCADLPLFYTINKDLNLSEQELLQVVNDLISFSDDLEKAFTDKDILNEDILKEELIKVDNKSVGLTEDRGKFNDGKWKGSNAYLFREKHIPNKLYSFNDMHFFNMDERFVKYYRNFDTDRRCVGIYKNDALEEETKLYNYIFENETI